MAHQVRMHEHRQESLLTISSLSLSCLKTTEILIVLVSMLPGYSMQSYIYFIRGMQIARYPSPPHPLSLSLSGVKKVVLHEFLFFNVAVCRPGGGYSL